MVKTDDHLKDVKELYSHSSDRWAKRNFFAKLALTLNNSPAEATSLTAVSQQAYSSNPNLRLLDFFGFGYSEKTSCLH